MKVIHPSFDYGRVELQNGQPDYMASGDISPVSVELVARVLIPATTSEHFHLTSADPRLIAPPEPLREASATPEFGY